MKLIKHFDIDINKKEMISVVGGGGKTTTIFKLAHELKMLKKKVLVTTTTAIYNPDNNLYDNLVVSDNVDYIEKKWDEGTITVLGRCISLENKLLGIDSDMINDVYKKDLFDFILIEADGSKKKPIKAPANHEPVIPSYTSKTIGIIGMDSLGKTIDEVNVHRSEIFTKVTISKIGDNITEEIICKLVTSNDGIFKGISKDSKKYLLLNKVEDELQMKQASIIGDMIRKENYEIDGMLAGSIINERIICI